MVGCFSLVLGGISRVVSRFRGGGWFSGLVDGFQTWWLLFRGWWLGFGINGGGFVDVKKEKIYKSN